MRRNFLSPKDYRAGFQAAQLEFELFLQLNNRLKTIRAIHQLKNGQTFLEAIGDRQQEETY